MKKGRCLGFSPIGASLTIPQLTPQVVVFLVICNTVPRQHAPP